MSQTPASMSLRSVVTESSTGPAGSFWMSVLRRSPRMAIALRNRWKARPIADLTERELADIGLTRTDVQACFRSGMSADPTVELARRARINTRTMSF